MPSAGLLGALCAALFLAAALLHGRGRPREPTALLLAVAMALAVLLFVAYFVADYFTGEGINEAVIYHLRYGLSGAGFAEYAALAAGALLAAALGLFLPWRLMTGGGAKKTSTASHRGRAAGALALAALALAAHPATVDLARTVAPHTRAAAAGVSEEARRREAEAAADFARHYRPPTATATTARKNLVFIYAESLERTYFDETLFPGLMPGLRRLAADALDFADVEQVAGTGWTIGGMVASQCGIPLFTPSHGNSMGGVDSFLPAARCLGNLLKDDGYRLAYLGGARLRFAGKGKFYETHGFDEVRGLNELRGRLRDPAYVSPWGLYDDELFGIAYERFVDLAKQPAPFGLFLLTLDTHHPEGHPSAACTGLRYGDGGNPMLNAVHCSDRLIAEFVARIGNSAWGKDTLVVIASDHLAMRNTASETLERGKRRNLFMVIDPDRPGTTLATRGSTLDVGATLLELLGHGARLGLGMSLLQDDAEAAAHRARVVARLEDWRTPLSGFWDFPRIGERLEIDARARKVTIDGRRFDLPVFIALDDDMRTTLQFPYLDSARDFLARNPPDKAFVLVAECASLDAQIASGVDCLFAGRGDRWRTRLFVRDKAGFTPEEIRRLTGVGS